MLGDTIKTAIITLVMSKTVKAFGEPDMADIIAGTGICLCGVQLALMLKPLQPGVEKSLGAIGYILNLIKSIIEGVGKIVPPLP